MDGALACVRLAAFAAGVVLFGAPLFAIYALRTVAAPPGLRPALATAALTGALATAAALVVQTGQMAGDPAAGLDPATLRDVLFGGGFGLSVMVRAGTGLLALALLLMRPPGRALWAATTGLGAVALGALAWSGHGAADEGLAGLAHTAADVTHLLAAGVWLGALAGFALLLAAPRRDPPAVQVLHRALEGFSGVGSVTVAALVASGLVNAWFLVGPEHLGDLAGALWGRLMLVKLAAFVAMLGLAALNRFRLTPGLGATLAGDPAAALVRLRRSIALETATGVAVLALVALLGVLAPPSAG